MKRRLRVSFCIFFVTHRAIVKQRSSIGGSIMKIGATSPKYVTGL